MIPLSPPKYRALLTALTGAIALSATCAFAGPLEDVSGTWLNDAKTGHIESSDCGDGTPCGNLVWIKTNQGDAPKDINNTDAALRTRPLVGIQMLSDFSLKKDSWRKGKIYNPNDGKTYGSSLKRLEGDILQVKGCLGPICKKQLWTLVN